MRTDERRFEQQAQESKAWTKPPQRWQQGRDGRQVRVYECLFCRDVGQVLLPAYHPKETDAELIAPLAGYYAGKTYANLCPNCNGGTERSIRPGEGLDTHQRDRMIRWYRAAKRWLEDKQARQALERMKVSERGVMRQANEAVAAMPALSAFEAGEIAAAEREAR